MDNISKAKQFVIDYFNKHDLNLEDEKINEEDIELLSFSQVEDKWKIIFSMPYDLIYILETTSVTNVYFTKYNRVGSSLYQWEN